MSLYSVSIITHVYSIIIVVVAGNCICRGQLRSMLFISWEWVGREILQMNSQLLLWSWKVAECSLVDNLIAKKLILLTFRPGAPVLRTLSNFPGREFPMLNRAPHLACTTPRSCGLVLQWLSSIDFRDTYMYIFHCRSSSVVVRTPFSPMSSKASFRVATRYVPPHACIVFTL